MKIALFENLTSGGSKREAHEFARQFVRAGHVVDVYSTTTADAAFLSFEGIVRRKFDFELELISNSPFRWPGLTNYFRTAGTILNMRRCRRLAERMASAIDGERYDFVFVHHDLIVQGPYLLRYLRTPSVYFCAEPFRRFYEPSIERSYMMPHSLLHRAQHCWYGPARALEGACLKSADRHNVRSARLLVTNSCFSAESIYRAYGKRARVVYLGVDVEKFCPADVQRENFVLSVGAIGPLKGYDFILEALGAVPSQLRPPLVIVGNTASEGERLYLQALATAHGIDVRLEVNVCDGRLVDFYRRAQLLLYAPVLEPFGLAPLEAMACATPVVAVKEGGVRESVIDGATGLLVDRTPSAFASAVSELLRDRTRREELGRAGCQRVLAFWTWEHAWHRLNTTIREFLSSLPCGNGQE